MLMDDPKGDIGFFEMSRFRWLTFCVRNFLSKTLDKMFNEVRQNQISFLQEAEFTQRQPGVFNRKAFQNEPIH